MSASAKFDQLNQDLKSNSPMEAHEIVEHTMTPAPNGKVAMVAPVQLGSASNVFSILRTEQNQVYANDDLDLVGFIHRSDVNTWGGSSGNLRYDVSIDGGASFTNDMGELNPQITRPARYPNMTGANPNSATDPFQTYFAYNVPVLDPSPDWDGHGNGVWSVSNTSTSGTENYNLLGMDSYLPGGLTEGLPGEFWSVDREYDGASLLGQIWVNKGTWNAGTNAIDWVRFASITPTHNTGFDGNPRMVGPVISFSPDGMTGWIGWLGDLTGGSDTTYNPCFMKSTDGGATWGTAVEYDLNAEAWVADSLQSLWTDSTGNPASTGRATGSFELDLTTDGNGNAHMALIVCSASTPTAAPSYSVYPGLAKFFADVHTKDGGATWDIAYISPVLTFRTNDFGTATTVSMDNQPQIARNEVGNRIFYSWADSDTAIFTGNMTGVGFGESTNLAPNLRIASMKTTTYEQSYPQLISDGDLLWEGRILFPTMAPVVLQDGGDYKLPIVTAEMPALDPLATTNFWYFGNDAVISDNYCDPSSMSLGWNVFGFSGSAPPCAVNIDEGVESGVVLGQSYPNPTAGEAVIPFELPAVMNVKLSVVNVYGQEVAVVTEGELSAGAHVSRVDTKELATGVYFYRLETDNNVVTKRMVVTK
ncbi:MAG: T9SS type A sorting domain-containing protein [Bacteroidota bacterium]